MVAGIVSGLLLGIFDNVFVVPVENRAIALEEQRAEAEAQAAGQTLEEEPPLVPVWVQSRIGEPIFQGLFGIILGLLFAGGVSLVRRAAPEWGVWATSLTVGALGFWSLNMVPFMKYPMNPPGVGEADTLLYRQSFQLLLFVLSLAGTALALVAIRKVRASVGPGQNPLPRLLGVAAAYIVFLVVILVAIPGNPDPVPVPIDMVELFRTLAMISQFLHWMGLAFFAALFLAWRQKSAGIEPMPSVEGHRSRVSTR